MPRPVIAVDSETSRITPLLKAPPLVCVSHASEMYGAQLLGKDDGIRFYRWALDEVCREQLLLVFHSGPFDLGVACAQDPTLVKMTFKAFEIGGIRDVKERQKLIDLADGNMSYARDPETGEFSKQYYSLQALNRRLCGVELVKTKNSDCPVGLTFAECGCGSWRLHYGELEHVPIHLWPPLAQEYAIKDAVQTLAPFNYQQQLHGRSAVVRWDERHGEAFVVDEVNQLRAGLALQLTTIWGMRTDLDRVYRLKGRLEAEQTEIQMRLAAKTPGRRPGTEGAGAIIWWETHRRGKNAGVTEFHKNEAAIQARLAAGYAAKGVDPPRTPTGKIKMGEESLRDCGDPDLALLAEGAEGSKILSTYVKHLILGEIHPGYNFLLETGRCSSRDPSCHQWPREMESEPEDTVRGCVMAREDRILVASDYKQIELVALAEVCIQLFGWSRLADAINAGLDVHLMMAAAKLGMTYEQAADEMARDPRGIVARTRQVAKGPDFGVPGGMMPAKLVLYVRSQPGKHVITLSEAQEWRNLALSTWQEWGLYFDHNKRCVGDRGTYDFVDPSSGRVRGECSYTQLCNQRFQGLVSNLAKFALWLVALECYVVETSPLYGSRPCAFVHDEIVIEAPRHLAAGAAKRLREVMEWAARQFIKHVKVECSVAMSRHLYKTAKAVYDERGDLTEWVPPPRKDAARLAA